MIPYIQCTLVERIAQRKRSSGGQLNLAVCQLGNALPKATATGLFVVGLLDRPRLTWFESTVSHSDRVVACLATRRGSDEYKLPAVGALSSRWPRPDGEERRGRWPACSCTRRSWKYKARLRLRDQTQSRGTTVDSTPSHWNTAVARQTLIQREFHDKNCRIQRANLQSGLLKVTIS